MNNNYIREEKKTNTRKTTTRSYEINEVNLETGNLFFENSKWLTTDETAKYLRVAPKQIRKWVYQGRLEAYKLFKKSLRFKKSDLDLLIEGGRKWE